MQRLVKIIALITIFLISSFTFVYPQLQEYSIVNFKTVPGLPTKIAYSVFKDSKGFMWFGTETGLYRWDGIDYKIFRYDPDDSTSISGNMIGRILLEDNDGNLWIGTRSSGLNIYNPSTESFTRFSRSPDYLFDFDFNRIHLALQDKNGEVWLASQWISGVINFNKSSDSFTIYRVNSDTLDSKANMTSSMYEDEAGRFWIGTLQGLYLFNKDMKTFTNFESIVKTDDELNYNFISCILEDKEGVLWMGSYEGLYKYDSRENKVNYFKYENSPPNNNFSEFLGELYNNPVDNGNSLWIITATGISKFDKTTEKITYLNQDPKDLRVPSFEAMISVLFDDSGILWVSSRFGAIRYNLSINPFTEYKIGPFGKKPYLYAATDFLEDSQGNIWVGTANAGLLKYNQHMNLVKRFNYDLSNLDGIVVNFVFSLFEDRDSMIWVGTPFGLDLFDQKNDRFIHCTLPTELNWDYIRINDIYQDSYGIIWVAAINGLYYQEKKVLLDSSFLKIPDLYGRSKEIKCIAEDSFGNLWFGSNGSGLYLLTPENRKTLTLINFKHNPEEISSISDDVIWSIYFDKDDILWIGTSNGLNRLDPNSDCFSSFNPEKGMDANFIYFIEGDNNGNLWLSTEKGIMRFKQLSDTTAHSKLLKSAEGVPFEDNYQYKIYKDKKGKIYVGGQRYTGNGFYCFHPNSLKDNDHIPPVVMTEFLVNNKPFNTDSSITVKKHLYLRHNQNFFSIEFAALDYINPLKNEYAFMLEGFDKDWIYSDNSRLAKYTNVPPGVYLFKAKGSNNDGLWNEEWVSLIITISPPPWKTWWAYSLYLLFLFSILYIVIRFYIRRQRLIHKLELEEVQTEKLEELDRMKSRFFANISHEFRTPITLILGPIEKLKSYIKDKEPEEDLNMMQRNAKRLQSLINQLLSLSKLESGKMKLQAHKVNFVSLVNRYVQSFESLAKQKNIEFEFKSSESNITLFVDRDKIEKILYNLLSNAFKFSGESGRIEVAVFSHQSTVNSPQSTVGRPADFEGRWVGIKISDTGHGIPQEKLTHIFDRFYQVDDNYTKDQEGSGIGLALTKELVELHHGKIIVKSLLDKGTTFTVFLPLGKDHLNSDEMPGSDSPIGYGDREVKTADTENFRDDRETEQILESNDQEVLIDDDTEKEDSKPLLLIVEDNDDLRSYIRSYLTDDYRIIEAIDGEMGLEKSIEKIPDLVISDVMMPKMDGYELCKKIKTDERTSHIPVILLTAKAAMEDKLEGLETGADDFLTKPFDQKELLVRIRNLIQQRRKLKELFIRELDITGQITSKDILSMDRQFLQKAKNIVEENMSDFDFNIENFAEKMCLSRVQLHRKLKALINRSASEFLRIIRLNHAAGLIRSKSGNITQITFEVGFNNLSYFSKCFKEQFGMLPSEYANQNS
jgi:signal transduction histidine kinase/ligand-binding sensor domain-containing protein/DNA-binding response OmpR family regulator